jgi:prepilin-type N-terminal cleavage/methylation domain-containing protein
MRIRTVRFKKNRKGGFTLIELLVVIAIIGILAAVVLVSLNSARVRGRDGRRLSDLQNIATALELYFDQNNTYVPSGGQCTGQVTTGCFTAIVGMLAGATPRLLPTATVTDPLVGNAAHQYGAAAIATPFHGYVLAANLEQNNQACNSDYDSGVAGLDTTAVCDDDGTPAGANICNDPNSDNFDYCLLQRQ